jgi:hypothetical protein
VVGVVTLWALLSPDRKAEGHAEFVELRPLAVGGGARRNDCVLGEVRPLAEADA